MPASSVQYIRFQYHRSTPSTVSFVLPSNVRVSMWGDATPSGDFGPVNVTRDEPSAATILYVAIMCSVTTLGASCSQGERTIESISSSMACVPVAAAEVGAGTFDDGSAPAGASGFLFGVAVPVPAGA